MYVLPIPPRFSEWLLPGQGALVPWSSMPVPQLCTPRKMDHLWSERKVRKQKPKVPEYHHHQQTNLVSIYSIPLLCWKIRAPCLRGTESIREKGDCGRGQSLVRPCAEAQSEEWVGHTKCNQVIESVRRRVAGKNGNMSGWHLNWS